MPNVTYSDDPRTIAEDLVSPTHASACCATSMGAVGDPWGETRCASVFRDGCTMTYQLTRCRVCRFTVRRVLGHAPDCATVAYLQRMFAGRTHNRGWLA